MSNQSNTQKRLFVDDSLCLGCKTCELRCAVERSSIRKTLIGAVREEVLPRPRLYVEWHNEKSMPIQCRHCADAPCLEICSTGAMQRDEQSGCVHIEMHFLLDVYHGLSLWGDSTRYREAGCR